jgi:hypothetical protein
MGNSLRLFALLIAFAFLGCSGDGASVDAGTGATGGTAGTGGIGGTGGAPVQGTFSVNQDFWHSGFHITILDGETFTRETLAGSIIRYVSINATFENLGPNETFFSPDISLVQDGIAAIPAGDTDIPFVPSGLASSGVLAYIVEENFDVDSAQLIVGSNDVNQAIVPLSPQAGDLVSLEPADIPISGSLSMELIDLVFSSGEIRADVLNSHSEIEAGSRGLTLSFDATSRKSGNWNILPQDFALILPGRSAVGVDGSELTSLPGSDVGVDTPGLSVRFLVDEMPTGDYTLRFAPGVWFVGQDDVTEATFDFSIE